MCGIVGAMGNLYAAQEKMFEWLLQLDTSRGPHSTGVLACKKNTTKTTVVKVIGTPWELFEAKRYDEIMKQQNKLLLGHNRWATTGAVTAKNAHPFTHGHITGVHNGTLRDQKLLDNHKQYEVDSDNIYHHMSVHGIADTIPKVAGAYCLVWFDEQSDTLNMIRNHERPLWFTTDEAKSCVFWASEAWMLHIASQKASVKIVQPMQLPVDTLLSLKATATGYEEAEGSGKVLKGHAYSNYSDGDWYGNMYSSNRNRGNVNTQPIVYEKVVFEVIGEVNGEYGAKTYSHTMGCVMYGPRKGQLVKIYASYKPEIRELLDVSTGFFVGEITCTIQEYQKATGKHLTVNQVNPSSIKTTPKIKLLVNDKSERKLVAGQLMTEKEFDKKCKLGCSWCTDLPKFKNAERVLFDRKHSEFLCDSCNTPENRRYFDYDEEKLA